jgi:hypothetical protein
MINAVKSGATNGIGLARPIASEPDLPKKILEGSVQSALQNVFDGDFSCGNTAANSQMEQAGRTTMQEAQNDPCYGIMDLTNESAAHLYKETLIKYHSRLLETAQQGRPIVGVLEFKSNGKI